MRKFVRTLNGREIVLHGDQNAMNYINNPNSHVDTIIRQMNEEKIYSPFLPTHVQDTVILDLGGNIGLFALHVCDSAKRVVSVEPTPNLCSIHKQFTSNEANIELIPCALHNADEDVSFYIAPENTTMNSTVNTYGYAKNITVRGLTLHSLLKECNIDRVDFAKIDIEGSELFSITEDTLRPVFDKIDKIFIEVHPLPNMNHEQSRLHFERILQAVGYQTKTIQFDTLFAFKA